MMEETDPRFLEPFVKGMQAARMAIVKRGWTTDAPMSTQEALDVIDLERSESVRLIVRAREKEEREHAARRGRITDGMVEAFGNAANKAANMSGAELYITDSMVRAGLAAALTRRELERRTEPELHPINLDPYPATIGVADEIVRFVLELEDGPALGLASEVQVRLRAGLVGRCLCFAPDHRAGCPEDSLPLDDSESVTPRESGRAVERRVDSDDCGHRIGPMGGCTGSRCRD